MLFQIATVVSWSMLSVTAIEFQRQPSVAISSQSFHRDDVPLSYKFSATHDYSSPKSVNMENHEPHLQKLYDSMPLDPESPKIQYAPLTGLYAKYYGTKGPKSQDQNLKRDHLEPRVQQGYRKPLPEGHVHATAQALQAHGDVYVPGHNIENTVLQTVTRFPAHNAVYKGYKDDSQNQNLRQHLESSPPPRIMSAVEAINRYATENAADAGRLPEKQPLVLYNLAPYTKKHSLLLNVGRTFNFEPKTPSKEAQVRDPILVQFKNPEILKHLNTHSVLFSQKIKEIPCYGCGAEYNLYKQ